MADPAPQIIIPFQCHSCGNTKFHKDEKRVHFYHDFINSNAVLVKVERRRYRCSKCGTKQWDHVSGASTHLKKTYRFLTWERTQKKGSCT